MSAIEDVPHQMLKIMDGLVNIMDKVDVVGGDGGAGARRKRSGHRQVEVRWISQISIMKTSVMGLT